MKRVFTLSVKHILLPGLVLILFLLFLVIPVKQAISQSSASDTANFPYWISMMQDPDANYFATVRAFEQYWENRPITKGCGWKVFKRWEYILKGRITSDGKKPAPDAVEREWTKFSSSTRSPGGTWTSMGPSVIPSPGPAGYLGLGRLNVVAFHPSDQNKIFAGSPSGGFWYSNDNGVTWATSTDNMPTIGVSAIIIDYSNPATVFIGTGDRDHGDAPGMGVYKSLDGGLTWSESKTGMGNVTVCKLIQHPANSLILLAATTNGIYRSVNGGATWSLTSAGSSVDICFKPGNPDVVYAEKSSQFFRSVNNGVTFIQITSGLTAGQRGAIAVSPANPEYVYFLQSESATSGFKGVYRSVDAGLNFSTRSTSPNILDWSCDGSGTGGQGWYDLVIEADPANAEIIYVGGVDVWKSSDGGLSWTINSHWYGGCSVPAVHADCHFLGFSPVNGRLYAGNDGGIYYTTNGGTTWTDCTVGMAIGQIYKLGQSQTDASMTINGFQDNGTYTNLSGGWVATGGGDGMECAVDFQNAAYTYHTIYFGSIFRKVNNSSEVQIAGEGVNGIDESGGWVTPFILSHTDPGRMFVGYKNVWRCTNVKATTPTWMKISTGETAECSVVEQSPANVNMLYVVRWGSMKRTDNANDASPVWISCTLPGGYTPTDLEAHPSQPSTIYATAGHHVYKSTDKGATWSQVPGTLPDIPINTIVYDKNSSEGLYIGTQTGVLYKNASMSFWLNYSSGLPVVDVRELEIFYNANSANNRIMAATYGRGLWKSDLYSPPNSPPVANFSIDPVNPCQGQAVHLTDLSLNSPLTWTWSFTPSTISFLNSTNSTSQHPQVQFNESRTYQVILLATNAYGSDTASFFINIGGDPMPLTSDFEPGDFPAGWSVVNPDNSITWGIATAGGNSPGTKSAYINFFDYSDAGQIDELLLSPVTLSGALHPWLKFRVAYRRWGGGYSDGLKVFVSNDCGSTWGTTPIYFKEGLTLATGPDQTEAFFPAATTDWRLDSVDLAPYINQSVKLKFQAINGWGNNLFIDDISIADMSLVVVQNVNVGTGQELCFNGIYSLRVAGSGTTVSVQSGGSAVFIAGHDILFQPGLTVEEGGSLRGYISTDGQYCTIPPPLVSAVVSEADRNEQMKTNPVRAWPNPINDKVNFELPVSPGQITAYEVYGMQGQCVLRGEASPGNRFIIGVEELKQGVYLFRLTSGTSVFSIKLIIK
jgi:PKD repeat protein/photosystem II stability/assembly factor-like uncharacterized protein